MGSMGGFMVILRVGNPWDHWACSLGGIAGDVEGEKPMVSLVGITGNLRAGYPCAYPFSQSKSAIRLEPVWGIKQVLTAYKYIKCVKKLEG